MGSDAHGGVGVAPELVERDIDGLAKNSTPMRNGGGHVHQVGVVALDGVDIVPNKDAALRGNGMFAARLARGRHVDVRGAAKHARLKDVRLDAAHLDARNLASRFRRQTVHDVRHGRGTESPVRDRERGVDQGGAAPLHERADEPLGDAILRRGKGRRMKLEHIVLREVRRELGADVLAPPVGVQKVHPATARVRRE